MERSPWIEQKLQISSLLLPIDLASIHFKAYHHGNTLRLLEYSEMIVSDQSNVG